MYALCVFSYKLVYFTASINNVPLLASVTLKVAFLLTTSTTVSVQKSFTFAEPIEETSTVISPFRSPKITITLSSPLSRAKAYGFAAICLHSHLFCSLFFWQTAACLRANWIPVNPIGCIGFCRKNAFKPCLDYAFYVHV